MVGKRSRIFASRVVRASAWTISGALLARASGAVAALAGSVLLGAAGYGRFSLLVSTVGLCSGIGRMGLESVVIRDLARQPAEVRKAVSSTALFIMVVLSTLVALIVVLASNVFTFLHPLRDDAGVAIWLLLPWSALTALNNQAVSNLMGVGGFRAAATLAAIRGGMVGGAGVAICFTGSVITVALGTVLAELIAALVGCQSLQREGLLGIQLDVAYLRSLVMVGSAAGSSSLLIQLVGWGSLTYLASQADGFAQIGVFSLGLRLGMVATVVSSSLISALLPFLSADKSMMRVRSAIIAPVLIALFLTLVTSSALPIIMRYWPSAYYHEGLTMGLMLVFAVVSVANSSVGNYAVAKGLLRSWVLSDVVLSLVMAVLVVITVPTYRAFGLALSQIAGYGVSALWLASALKISQVKGGVRN